MKLNLKSISFTMKNIHFILIATVAITTALTGCKGTQEMTQAPSGETVINEYCTGSEYESSSEYFRASGSATSPDREIAKKMAKNNVRADFVGSYNPLNLSEKGVFRIEKCAKNVKNENDRTIE